MKKKYLTVACVVFIAGITHAQKLFSTKTGQISFYAGTPLEDVRAINNETDSKMLQKNGQIIFSVLVKGFVFANALMQDHFNENYMESTKFPKADFKGFITNINAVDFDKDGIYNISAGGDLTIHGITQKVNLNGTLEVKGDNIILLSKFKIALKDFDVTGNYIGTKIAPEVEITVNCKYE
ncbi:MAG TPA: YceI family protein [Chitinophagaceae bacterium]|nr:YceI family protein [Chitinophagaceae bacterium]